MAIYTYTARTVTVKMTHYVGGAGTNSYISQISGLAADSVHLSAAAMTAAGIPPFREGHYFTGELLLYGTISGTATLIPYNSSVSDDTTTCEMVLWDQGSAEVADTWLAILMGSATPGVVAIAPAATMLIGTPPGLYQFAVRRKDLFFSAEIPHVLCSGTIEILPGIPEVAV